MSLLNISFLPHGYCLAWDPQLVAGFVISDALIGIAYYSIPIALMVFIRRNPQLKFGALFWMFSLFIFACGTGHLIGIVNLWFPVYRLDAGVRIITAAVSIATAIVVVPAIPKATAFLRFNREASARLASVNDELQAANAALRESEERTRLILKSAPIGLALVALDGRFTSVNRTLCEMLGYSEEELLAKTFQDITHPDDLEADLAYVAMLLEGLRDTYRMEKRYFHALGGVVHIQLDVAVLRDAQRKPIHFIAQIQDISERIEQRQDLERQAKVDPLTGLPNRRAFLEKAEWAFARARRLQQPVTVMMIDLDHFKKVNDRHGHPSGDKVLQAMRMLVMPRLRSGDMLARLGGEEFIVLLPNAGADTAAHIAERVRDAIAGAALTALDGSPLRITASVGVASQAAGFSVSAAIAEADRALYCAKREGRNTVVMAQSPIEHASDTAADDAPQF